MSSEPQYTDESLENDDAPQHDTSTPNVVPLRRSESLQRLRDRIETAARELERLRRENEALTERIRELEKRPDVASDAAFVSFDQDPATLRRKVQDFIEAIDKYLAEEK